MKIFITLLLCITASTSLAERIDGPANIRDNPNGNKLFTLDDGLLIYPVSEHGDWYKIHLLLNVKRSDYLLSTQQVLKGSPLFTTYRNLEASKAVNTVSAPLSQMYSEDGEGEIFTVVIEGYTYKENIKEKALIEESLVDLLETNHPVSKHELESYLKRYDYAKYWGEDAYFTGFAYPGDLVYDPSPTARIILFLCQGELCAISHQRSITFPTWRRTKASRGLELMFLSNFPRERHEEFMQWYNESFSWAD